jgi:PAS domain S-box-containing protein
MVAMPLFSSLVTGPKGAVNMAIISTSLLLYFYLLHIAGHPFPMVHGADEGRQLRGQFFLLAFITILAWYYERDRIAHMRHLTDATARAEATHRALQYSQAHVRQIAENIGQALWMYDMSSKRVVYANSGFERLWDMPRSRLAKNPRAWVARVHPEDLDFVPARADAHDHAYRIMLDDGQERWIRHAVYPVDAGEAEVQRVIHIAADITLKQTAEMMREQFIETVLEVQETERKHLARELHDETGQALTALLVGLKALDGTLKDAAQQEHVRLLRHQLRDVINDIGRLARGLHPAVLDEHGLKAAVTRLVNDLSDAHRIRGNVRTEGFSPGTEELIPRDARLTVYRICQEALTNVIRHAQATEFDVTLTLDDDNLYLRVEDDGKGFAPGDERSGSREIGLGMGMLSMRERAAMTGGQVLVESAPGMGTTVQVELPLFPRMSTAEARRAAFLNRDT